MNFFFLLIYLSYVDLVIKPARESKRVEKKISSLVPVTERLMIRFVAHV